MTKACGNVSGWSTCFGCPSEPVLRHEDVDIDDVAVGHHSTHDVVHLQFQDGMERSNYGPHLANYTCWDRNRLLRLAGEVRRAKPPVVFGTTQEKVFYLLGL